MNPFIALTIASGVMEAVGGIQRARAINSAARQNFRNALTDQAFQNTQNQRQFIERDRAARQSGFDAAMAARAAVASQRNSAASAGVSGNSVRALIAEEMRTGATNRARIKDQRDNNRAATAAQSKAIAAQTQGRINQTQTASFGLTDFAKIAVRSGMSIYGQNKQLDAIANGAG